MFSRNLMPAATKRTAILQAARELFSDRGYAGTRVPAIAAHAQVAAGTLYHYFPSKEALANALYRECLARFSEICTVSATAPVKVQFKEFCERFLAFIFEHKTDFTFLEAQCHGGYLDAESQAAADAFDAAMRALFRRWAETGSLAHDDVDLLVALTFGGLMGLFKGEQHGFATFTPAQRALAVEHLWHCLTVPVSGAAAS